MEGWNGKYFRAHLLWAGNQLMAKLKFQCHTFFISPYCLLSAMRVQSEENSFHISWRQKLSVLGSIILMIVIMSWDKYVYVCLFDYDCYEHWLMTFIMFKLTWLGQDWLFFNSWIHINCQRGTLYFITD